MSNAATLELPIGPPSAGLIAPAVQQSAEAEAFLRERGLHGLLQQGIEHVLRWYPRTRLFTADLCVDREDGGMAVVVEYAVSPSEWDDWERYDRCCDAWIDAHPSERRDQLLLMRSRES
jgi:hypothetical protein